MALHAAPDRPLLVLNAGSSTLKFSLFEGSDAAAPRLHVHGVVEGIGVHPRFVVGDRAPRTRGGILT